MIADTGVADSIDPSTISEIGRVAKQMLVASDCPASPATTKIIGIWLPRNAWAQTRTATLRLARLSCVCVISRGVDLKFDSGKYRAAYNFSRAFSRLKRRNVTSGAIQRLCVRVACAIGAAPEN